VEELLMKDKELEYLIKELEKDIDNYCGDYGTLKGVDK
jgi:hypothetical protein